MPDLKFNYRYAVFELDFKADDGRTESKIVFILYAPDVCDTKEKFLYASTGGNLRKKIQPFNKEFQTNDWADLDEENYIKVFK